MKITSTDNINTEIITPNVLLDKVKSGERPEYKYDSANDRMQLELDMLAEKYRQNMTLENKIELLAGERKLMYDELSHPEYTLARNYSAIMNILPKDIEGKEVEDIMRLLNATGIARNERLSGPYFHKAPKVRIKQLKDAYMLLSEDNTAGKRAKSFIIDTFEVLQNRNKAYYEDVVDVLKFLAQNTKDKSLLSKINTLLAVNDDASILLDKLKTNPEQFELFRTVLFKSKPNHPEIVEYVSQVLNSKNVSADIYRSAVWGAGKFRSDANFKIIKDIALNRKEQDVRKREFAIHSVALYLKDKPDEVKEIITAISREKSIFSDLGLILKDKITGKYHSKKDRELYYAHLNSKQIKKFKDYFEKFYELEEPLNIQQENACHRSLLPFRKQLGRLVHEGNRYILQHDTYTKQVPQMAGVRYITPWAGIYNAGDFCDAFDGIKTPKFNMMNYYRVTNSIHTNVMAHENGHTLQDSLNDRDRDLIFKLYDKAVRENKTLDYYAAANCQEYFAQGCEAYSSVYKPHANLLYSDQDGSCHTRFELMTKDIDLYKFVKRCLSKYN